MKFVKFSLLFAFLIVAILPIKSFACACCAEKGTYSIGTIKPDAYTIGELQKLKIGTANLYSDDGYPDTIKGIKPLGETFTASCLLKNNVWKFDFKDDKNKSGMLNLPMPTTMVDYRVDLQDNDEGTEATLYREYRF